MSMQLLAASFWLLAGWCDRLNDNLRRHKARD